ncbi:hypothetical protein UlMin_009987 [Ulmus minor]
MGQQQSKDELLYQQVGYGNIEGIKHLRREGAGLEWIDREGKTPLIVAAMNPELNVAKTLIELGANVNAYRPGRNAGTPLHHAAKRGLQNTVKLLLSHGANALVMNDDCQTPLDVAREKGHTNVVRAIEDAKPRTVIALWKANLDEPKSHQSDLSVIILPNSTISRGRRRRRRCRHRIPSQTRIKLAPEKEGDRQQLQAFCNACKGIPQAQPAFLHNNQSPVAQATAPPTAEDLELAMVLSASIQSAMQENLPLLDANPSSIASTSNTQNNPVHTSSYDLGASKAPTPLASTSEWPGHGVSSSGSAPESSQIQDDSKVQMINAPDFIASAPPISDDIVEDGPIQYPSIDSTPIDLSSQDKDVPAKAGGKKEDDSSSSCVICLDAPVEGACIPCGHMSGCMSCLNEIKAKKWGCPVCRAKIDQIIRVYSV